MSKHPSRHVRHFLSSLYGFIIRAGAAALVLCALYVGIVKGVLSNPVHITISQGSSK